jgi:hypothetical protein
MFGFLEVVVFANACGVKLAAAVMEAIFRKCLLFRL